MIQEVGSPGKSMILLTRGSADVVKKGEVLMSLKQGDHCGETMLLGLEQVWRVSLISSSSSRLTLRLRWAVWLLILVAYKPFWLPSGPFWAVWGEV